MTRVLARAVVALCFSMLWVRSDAQGSSAAAVPNEVQSAGAAREDRGEALPPDSVTKGAVTLASGKTLAYTATAGLLTVGSSDAQDAKLGFNGTPLRETKKEAGSAEDAATARMFYTAYFLDGADKTTRPIVFLYDGGPGASTRTMIIDSFGPVRVALPDLGRPVGGPYRVENNPDCLLDVADLVFIDAPGTGYSRIEGRDAAKSFLGIDQDAAAFDRFIERFLSKYGRWSSPKYLFGHSYGSMRNATVAWRMAQNGVAFNGMISVGLWLSQHDFPDAVTGMPGTENGYFLQLPSFAATAWYHHTVPEQPKELEPWLHEVEHYALGEYASALLAGADLTPEAEQGVARKLQSYTGIPAAIWVKANLRITAGEFEKLLLEERGQAIGRQDTRYTGVVLDPLAAESGYDPSGVKGAAVTAAMNSYVKETLKFGSEMTYEADVDVPDNNWDAFHVTGDKTWLGVFNVMPDLANTMKHNSKMHVLVLDGYFDLATAYFAGIYEMKHLPMPVSLQRNIEYGFFMTGHEPYIDAGPRRAIHDRVSAFVKASETGQ